MYGQIRPKRILAIKLRALGDTVLMTSALSELQKAFPSSLVDVIVTSEWAEILEKHPAIHQIWGYHRHRHTTSRAKAIARLTMKLRRTKYDLVCNFHASPSSAILSFGTGAKIRSIHFHGHQDKNRYSTVTIPGKGVLKPIIERDMDVVRALGLTIPEGRLPRIYLTEVENQGARDHLKTLGLKEPILAIGLGASRPTKIWPIENYSELAGNWCQETSGSVLAVASKKEELIRQEFLSHPSLKSFRDRVQSPTNLTIRQLAAILNQCDLFAGNDSGPKHIAVSVETPTVTMIGPEDPYEWHPYSQDLHPYHFVKDLACRQDALPGRPPWCGLDICTKEQHKCMKTITVEEVFKTCKKFLP